MATALLGSLYCPEAGGTEYLVKIAKVKRGAMLSIAEDEVGETAAERIEMPRKRVGEPTAVIAVIGYDRALQVGNDQANTTARFQNAEALSKQLVQFVGEKVFEHVRGVDGIDRIRGKRKPVSHVQPQVELVEEVAINIYEARQVLRSTA